MKFILLCLFIYPYSFVAQELKESDFELVIEEVKNTETTDEFSLLKGKKSLMVEVTLFNKSKDTLNYSSYEFASSEFDVDNFDLNIFEFNPEIGDNMILPPNKRQSFNLKIEYPKEKARLKFKIGMRLIDRKSIRKIIFPKSTQVSYEYIKLWSKKIKYQIVQ